MKKVWNTLNINNIRDYQDLYVQSHISLLINAFENEIRTIKNF